MLTTARSSGLSIVSFACLQSSTVGGLERGELLLERRDLLVDRFFGGRVGLAFLLAMRSATSVNSDAAKKDLQPVIVGRRDRVELVVVAASAADRQAEEDRADRAGDLGQLGLPFDLRDDVSADELAGPATAEAGGDQGIAIAG